MSERSAPSPLPSLYLYHPLRTRPTMHTPTPQDSFPLASKRHSEPKRLVDLQGDHGLHGVQVLTAAFLPAHASATRLFARI